MTREQKFTQFRRKQIAELRPYVPGEDLEGVSVSPADTIAGSPKLGDMIARNPKNHEDLWLVAAQYFSDNFEPVPALTAGEEAGGVKVKPLEWTDRSNSEYAIRWDASSEAEIRYIARAVRPNDMVLCNGSYYLTVDQAKAAAQADYDRRILSAIEPTPSPIVDDARVERADQSGCAFNGDHLAWAVFQWRKEVENRPLRNVHRRTLDDTWRQVIRRLGGNPDELLPMADHDTLAALSGAREGGGNALD